MNRKNVSEEDWEKAARMILNDHATFQAVANELGVSRQTIYRHFVYRDKCSKCASRVPIVYEGIRNFIKNSPLSIRTIALQIFKNGSENTRCVKFYRIIHGNSEWLSIPDIFAICRYMNMPFEEAFAPIKEDDHDNSAV